jgi:hypothetical protein
MGCAIGGSELYWIIFGVGVALGLFGLIRVFRYLVWMRIAWMSDGARGAIHYAIHDFEAGPVAEVDGKKCKIDERAQTLQKGMQKRVEHFQKAARWLWPQRGGDIASWASLPLEDAIRCVDRDAKKVGKKASNLEDFQKTMAEFMERYEGFARHFRDMASIEVVWAAASFALGALTVSLFTLWMQIA